MNYTVKNLDEAKNFKNKPLSETKMQSEELVKRVFILIG